MNGGWKWEDNECVDGENGRMIKEKIMEMGR